MLAGKGFENVINLSGGIKAWDTNTAVGPEDLGLALFSGKESPPETLQVAYFLEEGLKDFYQSMAPKVKDADTRRLFEKLADIEVKHQDRIYEEYIRISGTDPGRQSFARDTAPQAVEGGLTTEEYLQRYPVNLEAAGDVISLAMSIEAQALDLYQRAADRAEGEQSRDVLSRIAEEEREHLKQLGRLFEKL